MALFRFALVVCAALAALSPDISDLELDGALSYSGVIFSVAPSRHQLLRINTWANSVDTEATEKGAECAWTQLLEVAPGEAFAVPCEARHVLRVGPSGPSGPVGPDLGPSCKWRHGAISGGAIYAMPWQAGSVLSVDAMGKVTTLGNLPQTEEGKFGFTIASGRHVCGIPWAATQVLCVDKEGQLWRFGSFSPMPGKWRFASEFRGRIFAVPVEADSVLEIDAEAHSARELGKFETGSYRPILLPRWAGGLSSGQRLLGLPGFDCSLLQVDMGSAAVQTHALGCEGAVHNWHSAVVAKNGAIYALPFSGTTVLKIQLGQIQVQQLGRELSGGWSHALLSRAGEVYGVPFSAQKVLKVSSTDEVSQFGSFEPGVAQWKQGVLALNGFIYCIPERALTVLRIDPFTDTTSQLLVAPSRPSAALPGTPTSQTSTTTVQIMCLGFRCPASTVLRPTAAMLVCREQPCFDTCCLSSCENFLCPQGYSPKPGATDASCSSGYCSSLDLLTCCNVDLWYPNVMVPLLIFACTGLTCVMAQTHRCHKEHLSRRRKFSILYFTVLFAWDVCDQTASWWFWQYTSDVGASKVVQGLAMASAMLGTMVILSAFFAGLFMTTGQMLDHHGPELSYSVAAGTADVLMLVCAFIFEMEGLDEGSWIKVLNLIATLIDFTLKVIQAAGALFGILREEEEPRLLAPE